MPFEPDKITRANILEAVQRIESQKLVLKPSTVFDVIINNKPYPPKEIMRHAHAVMNGEFKWSLSGGRPTNKYLIGFGFEVVKKGTQADPVRAVIERYKKHIHATQFADESYKWVLIRKMQGKPDLKAQDFLAEIKRIEYKNLVYPMGIAVLLHITKERPEDVRQCFVKLFDDGVDLQKRIKTFSEETLALYRGMGKTENHHQDERSMATYLTFHDPDRYMFFKTTVYEHFCDLIKVERRKPKEKYAHYLELLDDFVDNYVAEDEELIGLKDQYLPKDRFEDNAHRLLAQDILYQMLDKAERQARKTEKRYWRIGTSDNKGTSYWSEMKNSKYASIGWSDLGDLTSEDIEKKDIIQMMTEVGYYDGNKSTITRKAGEIFNFLTVIKPGDVVLAQDGATVLGVGIVEDSEVRYEANREFAHNRAVDWKVLEPENFFSSDGNLTTVYEITDKNTIAKASELLGLSGSAKSVSQSMSSQQQSKNTILFGPPGTGKTFNSVNHAIGILENKSVDAIAREDRESVKSRFDRYRQEGRIVFTTFHQSMSYEDFVEGIKPEMIEEQIAYEIKPGIFKMICTEAAFALAQRVQSNTASKTLDFSELYDQFVDSIEKKLSSPSASEEVPTKSGGKIEIEGISPQGNILVKHKNGSRSYTISKDRLTVLDQNLGNLDEISNVNNTFRDIIGGSNSSAYFAILKVIRSLKPATPSQKGARVYSFADKMAAVKVLTAKDYQQKAEPFILIIDEINRGNIAQIFGELITLIEEDKRLGRPEALEATLPYSKDKFGVPPNLYIIGTMNTADRSVEALDTALRRRFSFLEMQPKPDLIATAGKLVENGGVVAGVSLPHLLTTINKRIEKLLDKDHLIGHSYLMEVDSLPALKSAFQNKIIPLLQEYFYGDFGKIGLVLGTGFFETNSLTSSAQTNFFADFPDYETVDLLERKVYRLMNVADMSDEAFLAALEKARVL